MEKFFSFCESLSEECVGFHVSSRQLSCKLLCKKILLKKQKKRATTVSKNNSSYYLEAQRVFSMKALFATSFVFGCLLLFSCVCGYSFINPKSKGIDFFLNASSNIAQCNGTVVSSDFGGCYYFSNAFQTSDVSLRKQENRKITQRFFLQIEFHLYHIFIW